MESFLLIDISWKLLFLLNIALISSIALSITSVVFEELNYSGELLRTRLYRRQLLCDSFFSLGNVFAHKCSENAFLFHTITCLITKSLQGRGKTGRLVVVLSGTEVPLQGRLLEVKSSVAAQITQLGFNRSFCHPPLST